MLKGKAGKAFRINGLPMETQHVERQVVKLFNSCRRWGVPGPEALERAMNQKLQRWGGNPNELIQGADGQWRWGDGTPAEKEAITAYRSVVRDEGDGFGPRVTTEAVESERFVRRGAGYAGLFKDQDMFQIMREIERAETAAQKAKNNNQAVDPG